jgi:hypothetical protein
VCGVGWGVGWAIVKGWESFEPLAGLSRSALRSRPEATPAPTHLMLFHAVGTAHTHVGRKGRARLRWGHPWQNISGVRVVVICGLAIKQGTELTVSLSFVV